MPNNQYMTYEHLLALRQEHAAWRLLRADYAPLAAAFFYQVFIAPKRRGIEVQELLDALDLFIYDCNRQEGEFARSQEDRTGLVRAKGRGVPGSAGKERDLYRETEEKIS